MPIDGEVVDGLPVEPAAADTLDAAPESPSERSAAPVTVEQIRDISAELETGLDDLFDVPEDGADAKPDDAKPEDEKPEDAKPEDEKPEDAKPEEAKPEIADEDVDAYWDRLNKEASGRLEAKLNAAKPEEAPAEAAKPEVPAVSGLDFKVADDLAAVMGLDEEDRGLFEKSVQEHVANHAAAVGQKVMEAIPNVVANMVWKMFPNMYASQRIFEENPVLEGKHEIVAEAILEIRKENPKATQAEINAGVKKRLAAAFTLADKIEKSKRVDMRVKGVAPKAGGTGTRKAGGEDGEAPKSKDPSREAFEELRTHRAIAGEFDF